MVNQVVQSEADGAGVVPISLYSLCVADSPAAHPPRHRMGVSPESLPSLSVVSRGITMLSSVRLRRD